MTNVDKTAQTMPPAARERRRRRPISPPGTYTARVLLPDGRPVADGYFRMLRMGGGWRGLFSTGSLRPSPIARWYDERQLRKVVLYVHGLGYAPARIRQASLESNPRLCELESLDGDDFRMTTPANHGSARPGALERNANGHATGGPRLER